jgi:metal-responsive CopG/Arc/MetJ family transcriptional regulator
MKTAVSIDDAVYQRAEEVATLMEVSRSRLYTQAISEYVQNHDSDSITEQLNQYYQSHQTPLDDDIKQATYDLFASEDW